MCSNMILCNRVQLRSEKEAERFRLREEHPIQGSPKIKLGKSESLLLHIWSEDLKKVSLSQLKQLNSNEVAFGLGRVIIEACTCLAPVYGYFFLNQNMVFLNAAREVSVWINPNIFENQVKIYLPPTIEGEKAMIRSIVSFLKLWLRSDFFQLTQAAHLHQLSFLLQPSKVRQFERLKPHSPRNFEAERRSSVNIHEARCRHRMKTTRFTPEGAKIEDKVSSQFPKRHRSPDQQSQNAKFLNFSLNLRMNPLKLVKVASDKEEMKNTTTLVSYQNTKTLVSKKKGKESSELSEQQKLFNNTIHFKGAKTTVSQSLGMKSYFPNKTTSNRNHIVQMIMEFDNDPNYFGKNNILMDDQRLREIERDKLSKLKKSLHGIGEQLNDLFTSSMLEGDDLSFRDISKEFQFLLE